MGWANDVVTTALAYQSRAKAKCDLTWTENDLHMIRELLGVLLPCCTKPLSKVALSTQNSYADNEQHKFGRIQF